MARLGQADGKTVRGLIDELAEARNDQARLATIHRLAALNHEDAKRSYEYDTMTTQAAVIARDVFKVAEEIVNSDEEDEATRFFCLAVLFQSH